MRNDLRIRLSCWLLGMAPMGYVLYVGLSFGNHDGYWQFLAGMISLMIIWSLTIWTGRFIYAVLDTENNNSEAAFIVLTIGVIGALAALMIFALAHGDWEKIGPLGDFFGGISNPVLTFLTFVGLLITILMQHREIRAGKEERKKAEEAQDEQTFDTRFFHMLELHSQIVNAIDIRLKNGLEIRGRDCFRMFFSDFKANYESVTNPADELIAVQNAFRSMLADRQQDLGHYLRYLFNVVRFVHESNVKSDMYIKLIRAQLSDYELAILFYNGMTVDGAKFGALCQRYRFNDKVPVRLVLNDTHQSLLQQHLAARTANP